MFFAPTLTHQRARVIWCVQPRTNSLKGCRVAIASGSSGSGAKMQSRANLDWRHTRKKGYAVTNTTPAYWVACAAAAREKKAPGAPIASRVGSRKSSRPDAFPWLETVECTGPQMERVANRFVRWKNISADAEWHSGDKRTNTCIAVEFQNLRGQWCPRFEKRTSSLGQCFGLFAATVFVEGALVTVYCGRVQRSKRTPFCVDSKRYTAEITSEGKKNRGSLILLVGQSIASRTISTVGRRSEVTFVCARVEGCLRLATSQLGKSFSFPMAGAL